MSGINVPQYRKGCMQTFSGKEARKSSLYAAKNTKLTNIHHLVTGIMTECTELISGMSGYICGESQLSYHQNIEEEIGDILYYTVLLAHTLKVKLPTFKHKSKLEGITPTKALLRMNTLAGDMLNQAKKNLYYSVVTKEEDGKVVLDKQAHHELVEGRVEKIKEHFEEFSQLLWAVSRSVLNCPLQEVAEKNLKKLSTRYGDGFSLQDQESRDVESEMKAMGVSTPF